VQYQIKVAQATPSHQGCFLCKKNVTAVRGRIIGFTLCYILLTFPGGLPLEQTSWWKYKQRDQ